MPITQAEIDDIVDIALKNALQAEQMQDADELVKDLGLESLDMLDVVFRIERGLSDKVRRQVRIALTDVSAGVLDGRLTEGEAADLRDGNGMGFYGNVGHRHLPDAEAAAAERWNTPSLTVGRLKQVIRKALEPDVDREDA